MNIMKLKAWEVSKRRRKPKPLTNKDLKKKRIHEFAKK